MQEAHFTRRRLFIYAGKKWRKKLTDFSLRKEEALMFLLESCKLIIGLETLRHNDARSDHRKHYASLHCARRHACTSYRGVQ